MTKFVLTGATGQLGSRVLQHLLKLVLASDIIVSLYNPSGATSTIKGSGVEIRRGDYADPASLDAAFAGADKLLLVSHPAMAHELRVAYHKNAIDAAKRVGIKRVYYTSLAFAGDTDTFVMRAHLDTERYLQESGGVPYTILREGVYSEAWRVYFGFWTPAETSDEVVIPHGDGPIAYACLEDLGEGTAKILAGYENETLLLTGTSSFTLKEIAATVSRLLGRDVKLIVGSEDDYVKANLGRPGLRGEEAHLRKFATTYKALERGELDLKDPLLQNVLGREPKSFEHTLRESLGLNP
ncbi:NmrA-like family protein [Lentinus brumalis]|uniref:NmrA-like family protein n=1 Tax=Lentinus brumalis TaxID=2498619 RepID=A0A371D7T9_9APHY|nr:NmrA-like family protein [Polyporus brumalis]